MSRQFCYLSLILLLAPTLYAQSLDLPPRPPMALKGAAFARAVMNLPLDAREEKIVAEVEAGNVPPFLRRLVAVPVEIKGHKGTYFVTPDYLAIGSDDDYFLTPLSPLAAQAIADRLDCILPTPRMVDQIYAQAAVQYDPAPIPPSPAMTTVEMFLRHNEMVRAAWPKKALGLLVAGHKKDVVIATKVLGVRGKVAIYGWHKRDGKPIQPLYAGHSDSWVDYSHGIRLVSRRIRVDGVVTTIDRVLADPAKATLLSDEGVMVRTRYERTEPRPLPRAAQGGKLEAISVEPGVRVVIDRPGSESTKPVLLVFYALPNGNTIEQTVGRAKRPGDDWHFAIQHIGAQLGFLRKRVTHRSLVVAYLENDLQSWPSWRRKHGDPAIRAIINAVRSRFDPTSTRVVLSAHSGGGSLIFGYLNTLAAIPEEIERIAFLDANYAYESPRHRDKLAAWLKSSNEHYLVVLAYNDAAALLDGKPFVSADGGTWGRSHTMRGDLQPNFPLQTVIERGIEKSSGLDGRICFLLRENPERKVWHTVLVEKNGFIESLLSGTSLHGVGYTYMGDRAYTRFILPE